MAIACVARKTAFGFDAEWDWTAASALAMIGG
jgi:hypothetical protein